MPVGLNPAPTRQAKPSQAKPSAPKSVAIVHQHRCLTSVRTMLMKIAGVKEGKSTRADPSGCGNQAPVATLSSAPNTT